jgi:hypothetical protein
VPTAINLLIAKCHVYFSFWFECRELSDLVRKSMPLYGKSPFVLAVIGLVAIAAPAHAGELEQRQEIRRIDRQVGQYTADAARTSSGLWKTWVLFNGVRWVIGRASTDDKKLVSVEKQFLDWAERYPNSTTAHIGYAAALTAHAWYFRGDGPASAVRDQDWAPFRDYLEKARVYLMEHADDAHTDPQWYTEMLVIARGQGWPEEAYMNLVSDGLKRHPYFYPIYFSALRNLLPKWGGSIEAIDAFALAAVKYTKEEEGQGMYARIYWSAYQIEFGNELFSRTKVDWSRMSVGIDDVLARFPAQWNINNFAHFACLAGDREKARSLIAMIEGPPIHLAWKSLSPTFEECRDWANG